MYIVAFLATLVVAIFGWQTPAEAFRVEYPYVTYEKGDNPTKICKALKRQGLMRDGKTVAECVRAEIERWAFGGTAPTKIQPGYMSGMQEFLKPPAEEKSPSLKPFIPAPTRQATEPDIAVRAEVELWKPRPVGKPAEVSLDNSGVRELQAKLETAERKIRELQLQNDHLLGHMSKETAVQAPSAAATPQQALNTAEYWRVERDKAVKENNYLKGLISQHRSEVDRVREQAEKASRLRGTNTTQIASLRAELASARRGEELANERVRFLATLTGDEVARVCRRG